MSDPVAMKIIQITPGSGGGFYCENCMRDEAAARALRAAGHDALMVPLYLPLVGLARRIRRALAAPVVCLLQDEDEFLDVLPEPWRGQAWRIIAERAADVDRFIAVSEYFRGAMRDRLGEAGARIDVMHVGIVPQDYSPADGPPKAPVVGFLSRACRAKGLDILVEALDKVRSDARLKSVRLRVAGGSAAEDSAYLRTVRRRLDKLGLAEDVEFLANLDAGPRHEFLRSLSVLSVPARRGEASGMYVLEALATGVPVVVPDSGVFPELLAATGGGVLCKPEDPSSLAAHLSDLLLDPQRLATLGREGREKVVTEFSVQRMVENMANIYQEMADAAHGESLC